jgi:uncharacterized protein YxeA
MVHSEERRQVEGTEINQTVVRPITKKNETKSGYSLASVWKSGSKVQQVWSSVWSSVQQFLSDTANRFANFSRSQKVLVVVILAIVIASAFIWGALVRYGNQVMAANQKKKEQQEEEERQRSQNQWKEAVDAYRNAMQGKNSQTVIRGSKTAQPKESAILQAAIAQAKVRHGTAARTPQEMQAAEEKARELRAQAALARLSGPSKDESSSSTSAGSSETCSQATLTPPTDEEAELNRKAQSRADADFSLGGSDFEADHLGPVACTYFRK